MVLRASRSSQKRQEGGIHSTTNKRRRTEATPQSESEAEWEPSQEPRRSEADSEDEGNESVSWRLSAHLVRLAVKHTRQLPTGAALTDDLWSEITAELRAARQKAFRTNAAMQRHVAWVLRVYQNASHPEHKNLPRSMKPWLEEYTKMNGGSEKKAPTAKKKKKEEEEEEEEEKEEEEEEKSKTKEPKVEKKAESMKTQRQTTAQDSAADAADDSEQPESIGVEAAVAVAEETEGSVEAWASECREHRGNVRSLIEIMKGEKEAHGRRTAKLVELIEAERADRHDALLELVRLLTCSLEATPTEAERGDEETGAGRR